MTKDIFFLISYNEKLIEPSIDSCANEFDKKQKNIGLTGVKELQNLVFTMI